jgi:Fe-S-cluster formation regulator IscX/YfhJ
MKVIGIGERKTPNPFIVACDKFIYIEIINAPVLKTEPSVIETNKNKINGLKQKVEVNDSVKIGQEVITLIATSITDLADENGWAFLGEVGNMILKKQPDFDPRNFGYAKLTPLIKVLGKFEIDERETGQYNIKHIFIRNKK